MRSESIRLFIFALPDAPLELSGNVFMFVFSVFVVYEIELIDERLSVLFIRARHFGDEHGGDDGVLVAAMRAGEVTVALFETKYVTVGVAFRSQLLGLRCLST